MWQLVSRDIRARDKSRKAIVAFPKRYAVECRKDTEASIRLTSASLSQHARSQAMKGAQSERRRGIKAISVIGQARESLPEI